MSFEVEKNIEKVETLMIGEEVDAPFVKIVQMVPFESAHTMVINPVHLIIFRETWIVLMMGCFKSGIQRIIWNE